MLNTDYITAISNILQKSLSADETYGSILEILEQTIPFDSATLFVYRGQEDKLEVVQQQGDQVVDLAQDVPFAGGNGLSSWMLRETAPVVLPSVKNSRPGKDRLFNSFVSMPLRVGEKLIGVLNLGHMEPNMYTADLKDKYATIATQVSLVMEKISLRTLLEEQNAALRQALVDLQQAQKQLVEKERLAAIGEIVVTVNHEINNPLAAVIGLAEILDLMVQTGDPEKIRESTRAILKGALRIKGVTEKLTRISSSESQDYVAGIRMTKLPEATAEKPVQ